MESHCKLIRFIIDNNKWSLIGVGPSDEEKDLIDSIELQNGIENWAQKLIDDTKQDWDMVYWGKSGLIEISVIRNALMHGYTYASNYLINKAKNRGCKLPYSEGDKLQVDFEQLHEYRGRIRSLCRILGDGVIHMSRKTHKRLDT